MSDYSTGPGDDRAAGTSAAGGGTTGRGAGGDGTEAAIRESLAGYVAGVRMPGDLLDRAMAGNRRRTVRRRLIGGGSLTVAAVVAAGLAVVGPGHLLDGHLVSGQGPVALGTAPSKSMSKPAATPAQQSPPSRPAQSQPAQQTESAAALLEHAAVNSDHMISVEKTSGGIIYTDVAARQQRIVSTKSTSEGLPYYQIGTVIKGGMLTQTTVVNPDRVYSVQSMPAGLSGVTSFLPLQTTSDPEAALAKALGEGAITPAGHQDLDGQDTVVYQVKALTPQQMAADGLANTGNGGQIWVDATTDLIVKTDFLQSTAAGLQPVVINVSWLSPTPQNLASLTISPPAGFTEVPYSEVAQDLGPIS